MRFSLMYIMSSLGVYGYSGWILTDTKTVLSRSTAVNISWYIARVI